MCCILLCVMYIEYFYIHRYNNFLYKYVIYIKNLKSQIRDMFRHLLAHHQVYCLCLDANFF
jgi:hypothetical protein